MIPVRFVVEMDRSKLETLKKQLVDSGISVVRAGEDRFIEAIPVVLVGHILDSDLGDTVKRIDSTGFAEVFEISMSMPAINERSTSRVTIKATNRVDMDAALAILRRVAQQKSLLLIEPLEEIA
jgi:ACT domain-containing protein